LLHTQSLSFLESHGIFIHWDHFWGGVINGILLQTGISPSQPGTMVVMKKAALKRAASFS